jgi:parvulin-like peptidyl-prolyl isomerase
VTNRLAAAGVAVLAVLAVSGCGAVPDADTAASVAGDDITVDSFQRLLQVVTDHEDLFGIPVDPVTGTVEAAQARSVLTLLIQGTATDQYLTAGGQAISDEDRQAVIDSFGEENPLADLPDDISRALVDSQAGQSALARMEPPSAEELRERYEADPAGLGVVCVRHVQVASEPEAQAVLEELAAGAAIADVAVERSTEQGAATTGGALQAAEGIECAPLAGVRERFGDDFAAAAVASRAGAPSGPVQSTVGWHVVEAQAFDDIADSLVALDEQSGGQLQFLAFMNELDVRVDPRYGRWDPASSTVGAL